jgi:hypothetical protein
LVAGTRDGSLDDDSETVSIVAGPEQMPTVDQKLGSISSRR